MRVSFTDEALADLSSIRGFIADRNPNAADRIGRRLIDLCDSLAVLPERGAPGSVEGTRESAAVWPYVVVYRVLADEVQVLRVWHGAQSRDGVIS